MMNLKTLAAQVEDRKNEKGFTLIELIIVVAIIGILVAIAIPVYGAIQSNSRQKAVDAAAKDSVTAIVAALSDDDDNTTAASAVENYGPTNTDAKITLDVDTTTVPNEVTVVASYVDPNNTETGEASATY